MQLADISLWGVLLLLLLAGGVLALFAYMNRSMMQRIVRVVVYALGSLLLLGGCVWGLCRLDRWWADALWMVLVVLVLAFLIQTKARQPHDLPLLAVPVATLAGMAVAVGCLLLCLSAACSTPLFLALVALVGAQLYASMPLALQTFQSSLRHTQAHVLYLQANGASRLEALMPSIRRGLRAAVLPLLGSWVQPLVVAPPALLCGLLLSGMQPVAAFVVTFLALLASLVGCVAGTVVMLWIICAKLPASLR